MNTEKERAIVFDGLDEAIIGVVIRAGKPSLLCYDEEKIISLLEAQGMSNEEAVEYADFNIHCLYAGEGTPVILCRMTKEEAIDAVSDS